MARASKLKITCIECPSCNDIIYSRARHDMRSCSCGKVFIDGGFDYCRVGFKDKSPKYITVEVDFTKEELYKDWNEQIDKCGLIKNEKKGKKT